MRRSTALWIMNLVAVPLVSLGLSAQVSVLTYQNDNGRTGQNTNEVTLTASNVNKNQFGLLCRMTVSGFVYGQPLIVADSGDNGMTVYVATMQDWVYAFKIPPSWDGKTCGQDYIDIDESPSGDSRGTAPGGCLFHRQPAI